MGRWTETCARAKGSKICEEKISFKRCHFLSLPAPMPGKVNTVTLNMPSVEKHPPSSRDYTTQHRAESRRAAPNTNGYYPWPTNFHSTRIISVPGYRVRILVQTKKVCDSPSWGPTTTEKSWDCSPSRASGDHSEWRPFFIF